MLFIQVRSDGRAGASSKTKMQFMPLAPRKKKEVVDDDLPKDEEWKTQEWTYWLFSYDVIVPVTSSKE